MSVTREYPIFIICRDRLSPLLALLHWLDRVGQTRVYLVDNASTFPPLLDFYTQSVHHVIRLGSNIGHKAVWLCGAVEQYAPDEFYVVTDPDIVPVSDCPSDALTYFHRLLDRYPDRAKVGFGLKIDDLPDHYRFASEVRGWEGQFWAREVEPGVYDAPIDTTFALYRPHTGFREGSPALARSLRTGAPYLARHTAWYVNSGALDEEECYYRAHARADITHWNVSRLPPHLVQLMRGAGVWPRRPPFWRRPRNRRTAQQAGTCETWR